jgi:hypothetical protein
MKDLVAVHVNASEYMDQLYKMGYRRHIEHSDLYMQHINSLAYHKQQVQSLET